MVTPAPLLLLVDSDCDNTPLVRMLGEHNLGGRLMHFNVKSKSLHDFLAGTLTDDLPRLIFLDLELPKAETIRALRKIRSTPDLGEVPLIALTVFSDDPNLEAYYQLGISGHLVKPVCFEDLSKALLLLGLDDILPTNG